MATKSKKSSPLKWAWVPYVAAIAVPLIIKGVEHLANTGKRGKIKDSEEAFDKRLTTYEKSKFKPLDRKALRRENIFEGQENIFAGRENIFADQENIMEDMEIDTKAVDYAREQFQQQQANIMQGMRGVAGASGTAGLAQALSGQASQQARESQLTIGGQLQQNRRMRLQEQSRLNQQERAEQARLSQMGLMEQSRLNQMSLAEQSRLSQMSLAEQSRINQQDRQLLIANMEGARQFEIDKLTTLLGVEGQRISGAQGAIASRQSMYGDIAGGLGTVAGSLLSNVGYTKEGGWTLG